MKPKVFVSHAGTDRERFVNLFVNRLKSDDIDVWFSEDKIAIGDSIPKKIEEGISSCNCMIVVYSRQSKDNQWVQLEQEIGIYKHVTKQERILYIVLDNVSPPKTVQHIRYCQISDLKNYDKQYSDLLTALRSKAEVGEAFQNERTLDDIVLSWFGDQIDNGQQVSFKSLCDANENVNVDNLASSVNFLYERKLAYYTPVMGGMQFVGLRLTPAGYEEYLRQRENGEMLVFSNVRAAIIAGNRTGDAISRYASIHHDAAKMILQQFAEKKYINIFMTFEDVHISYVYESLKRVKSF